MWSTLDSGMKKPPRWAARVTAIACQAIKQEGRSIAAGVCLTCRMESSPKCFGDLSLELWDVDLVGDVQAARTRDLHLADGLRVCVMVASERGGHGAHRVARF